MAKEKKEKVFKKKLTSTGAGAVTLTTIAALLSIAAACGDLIAALIYNQFYPGHIDHYFSGNADAFIHQYSLGVTMAVLSVIMFIWAVSAARSRKLGREFGFINICLPAAVCAVPGYDCVELIMSKATTDAFNSQYDGDKFRAIVNIAITGVPVIAGVLLMLAGIGVLVRLSDEDFYAVVPAAPKKKKPEKKPEPKPEEPKNGNGLDFGSHNDKPQEPEIVPAPAPIIGEAPEEPEAVIPEAPAEEKPEEKPAEEVKKLGDELRICKACGTIAKGNEKFCSNCGALL